MMEGNYNVHQDDRTNRHPQLVVYSLDTEERACAIIRIIAPFLAKGWDVTWAVKKTGAGFSTDLEALGQADLVIIQRHFPAVFTEQALKKIIAQNVPIVYDLDDMFLDISPSHPHYKALNERVPYIKWMLNEADAITVSTLTLQKSLGKHTRRPIHVQPNLVDWSWFYDRPRPHTAPFNLLVSGTPTHQSDWQIIEEPLAEILNTYTQVKAIFFGELPARFVNHPSVRLIGFLPGYREYADQLKGLDVHLALVPLEDTPFNRCKSNIKWLEYSAAGIPGIYSDITPYRDSITHGKTGLLVANTSKDWFTAISGLLANPNLALALVENAQTEAYRKYAIEMAGEGFIALFGQYLHGKHDHPFLSGLPSLPVRLKKRMAWRLTNFLDKYVLWRFNK